MTKIAGCCNVGSAESGKRKADCLARRCEEQLQLAACDFARPPPRIPHSEFPIRLSFHEPENLAVSLLPSE